MLIRPLLLKRKCGQYDRGAQNEDNEFDSDSNRMMHLKSLQPRCQTYDRGAQNEGCRFCGAQAFDAFSKSVVEICPFWIRSLMPCGFRNIGTIAMRRP